MEDVESLMVVTRWNRGSMVEGEREARCMLSLEVSSFAQAGLTFRAGGATMETPTQKCMYLHFTKQPFENEGI